MPNMGEKLYKLLPEVYKKEDSKISPNPYPLNRYFQVAGKGLDFLESKIEDQKNIYDINNVPKEFLPYIASTLGFEFPYEMSEREQRNFLRILPDIYKYKGTKKVYSYLGQAIFGEETTSDAKFITDEENQSRIIDLSILVSGELTDINSRTDRYKKFAEVFRILNTLLNVRVNIFYSDKFDRKKVDDNYIFSHIQEVTADSIWTINSFKNSFLLNSSNLNQESLFGESETVYRDDYTSKSSVREKVMEEFFALNHGVTSPFYLNTSLLNNGRSLSPENFFDFLSSKEEEIRENNTLFESYSLFKDDSGDEDINKRNEKSHFRLGTSTLNGNVRLFRYDYIYGDEESLGDLLLSGNNESYNKYSYRDTSFSLNSTRLNQYSTLSRKQDETYVSPVDSDAEDVLIYTN